MISRIVAFPRTGPPYVELLYDALERAGVRCVEGDWSGRWLIREIRRGDVVHLHWPSFAYYNQQRPLRSWARLARFLVVLVFVRFRGATIAWTAHNLYPHDGGAPLAIHRIARRAVVRLAHTIYVHGRTAAGVVAGEFSAPAHKLVVLDHGHFIGRYPDTIDSAQARRRLGIDPGAYVHLFIGHCKPYKNLLVLISAFRGQPAEPASALVIAGHFQSADYQREVEQAASADRRILLVPGSVPDDELQVYLRAADSVVLPYAEVLTSGAVVLAMSFGKPVVAPAIGSLVDYVPAECGVLYDPDDPTALDRALTEVRTTQFDAERIVRWIGRFTWDATAAAMLGQAPRRAVPE